MAEDNNYDKRDGILSRRGLVGATLAATGGLGLLGVSGIIGGSSTDLTVIDDAQSTSTKGSSVVYVDTSSSGTDEPITVTIDAANEQNGASLEVYDVGEKAGQKPITIKNSSGEFVTELAGDRAYIELIYHDTRWLIKTSDSKGVWTTESNTAIPDSGAYLVDSWNDGAFTRSSIDQAGGSYTQADGTTLDTARLRPDWNTIDNSDNDSPRVSNNHIVIDGDGPGFYDGDFLVTESEFFVGEWKFDMRIPNYYIGSGSHGYKIQLISDNKYAARNSGDWWGLVVRTDYNGTHLVKCESGTETDVISGGDPLDDESWNTVEIRRKEGGHWEVLVGGNSLGTATDSFLPSPNWFGFGVRNNDNRASGNEYHIDNLRNGDI